MALPVAYVQQIFQNAMFHASILLGPFQKLLGVLDCLEIETVRRLCSEGISDGVSYDIFGRTGAVSRKESTAIEVSVSVENTFAGH